MPQRTCSGEGIERGLLRPGRLREMVASHDAFLIDAWGVLYNGGPAFPAALECLRQLAALGKTVVILSNAGRRVSAMVEEMAQVGVTPGCYQHLLSSGELAWRALAEPRDEHYRLLGDRCYYLGPRRSRGMLDGLDIESVENIDSAQFILNCGPEGNPHTTDEYLPLLRRAAARQLPMVCANPDLVAMRHGCLGIAAGSLAQTYRDIGGGPVFYHGKPHAPTYTEVRRLLPAIPDCRVLAIGDAMATDITGAVEAGFHTLLIGAGIHRRQLGAGLPEAALQSLFDAHGCQPGAVMWELTW